MAKLFNWYCIHIYIFYNLFFKFFYYGMNVPLAWNVFSCGKILISAVLSSICSREYSIKFIHNLNNFYFSIFTLSSTSCRRSNFNTAMKTIKIRNKNFKKFNFYVHWCNLFKQFVQILMALLHI